MSIPDRQEEQRHHQRDPAPRAFPRVTSALAKVGERTVQRVLRFSEVGLYPASIPDIRPSPPAQILDRLGSIPSGVEVLRKIEGKAGELLSQNGVLGALSAACLQQQLEDSPGVEARMVVDQDPLPLGGMPQELGDETLRLRPLSLIRGLQILQKACARCQGRIVS